MQLILLQAKRADDEPAVALGWNVGGDGRVRHPPQLPLPASPGTIIRSGNANSPRVLEAAPE